ncbi:aminotransferase class III-fold pyridoxal phosphate-dependent enzyme [Oerskovia sp. M15]
MARRNSDGVGGPGTRTRVLALEGGFHGRSMGALALTSKAAYREPFEPLPGGVEFVPFGDTLALEEAFSAQAVAERGRSPRCSSSPCRARRACARSRPATWWSRAS